MRAGFSGSCSSFSPSFPAWAPSFELEGHLSLAQLPLFRTVFLALYLCHSHWLLIASPTPCLRSHLPGCALRIPHYTATPTSSASQPSHTTSTGGSLPHLTLLGRCQSRAQSCVPCWYPSGNLGQKYRQSQAWIAFGTDLGIQGHLYM